MKETNRGRVALLALAVLGVGTLTAPLVSAAPPENRPAPAFSARTVDTNKPISLAAYKGKSGVLLNFYQNT